MILGRQHQRRDTVRRNGSGLLGRMAMLIMRYGRAVFGHTPVERLRITSVVYRLAWRVAVTQQVITTDFRGCRLTLPAMDVTIAPGLVGGYYERLELTLFERLVRVSGTVLDVGGNVGIYACVGGIHLPEGGLLVTFEPEPENLDYLRRNLTAHGLLHRVRTEPFAVGASDGELSLYVARTSTGRHSASPRNAGHGNHEIRVPVLSLDNYLHRTGHGPVDLLKIDVEGYDGFVLRGASETLRRDRPTLLIEFAPEHLRNCGFAPDEMVSVLCVTYRDVFLIDERRQALRPVTATTLAWLARGRDRHNLVAVARPDHLELITTGDVVRAPGHAGSRATDAARPR